jgi:hypothetical protein
MAVARQPRHVGDERVAAPRQPVEQRGLADVRPADDRYDREHGYAGMLNIRDHWTVIA